MLVLSPGETSITGSGAVVSAVVGFVEGTRAVALTVALRGSVEA